MNKSKEKYVNISSDLGIISPDQEFIKNKLC